MSISLWKRILWVFVFGSHLFVATLVLPWEPSNCAQVLGAIGMGGAKLLDCDQLAVKLLDRVCNPPSVLELHELGS